MEAVKQFIYPLLETMGTYLPSAFGALLVFLAGFGLAMLIRKGVSTLLASMKLDERLAKKSGSDLHTEAFLTNLAYYVFLLWVLLITLDVLGVKGVLNPVMNMFDTLLAILPNVVAAVLIGFAGYVISKIVSSAANVLTKGLDSLSSRIGLSEEFRFSRLIEHIVFIVIFVPILISALDALKIAAISVPSTNMLSALLAAIPKILAAGLVLAVAYFVGRFVTSVVSELLHNMGADSLPEKIGIESAFGEKTSFSRLCGGVVFFFIMLAAAISAVDKLAMPQLSDILSELLVFAGQIVLGLVVLAVGNLLASLAYKTLRQDEEHSLLASVARFAILGLVIAMGLRAMGIADDIVNLAFGLILGAIAIAVALSFGLGGREAAGRHMEYWLSRFRKE